MSLTVTGVKASAEADGSYAIEMSDGSVAIIPRDQVPVVAVTLQRAVAQRVFAQSQRLDIPTESTLALTELHLDEVKAKHDALPRPQSVSSKRNQSIASFLITGLIALRVLAGIARTTSKAAPVFCVTLTVVLLLLLYLGYRTYKVIRASRTEPSTQQD